MINSKRGLTIAEAILGVDRYASACEAWATTQGWNDLQVYFLRPAVHLRILPTITPPIVGAVPEIQHFTVDDLVADFDFRKKCLNRQFGTVNRCGLPTGHDGHHSWEVR